MKVPCTMRTLLAISVFTLLVTLAQNGQAAIGDHISSQGFPTGAAGPEGLELDGSNNFVTHGAFFGTIDLGGGPMTAVNFLDGDQYVARFDVNGNHLWSTQYTPNGAGASQEVATVDPAGNVYISGYLFINTTIDYGGGVLTGPGLYVAKFDANGTHQWSTFFGDARPKSIAANNSHVVVTGYTSAGIDFGGGTIGNSGGNDVFVAQLTGGGAHAWSAGYGDVSDQGGMRVKIDGSGNVVLVGTAFGTIDLGGGPLVAVGLDLFLAKYSPTGVHQWSTLFDGTFSPGGGILATVDVATGPSDEIALAGEMVNTIDLGGGVLTSNGFGDIYVGKFDANGVHQWSTNYGVSNGSDQGKGVAIDASGNVLLTGSMIGDIDFGGGIVSFVGDPLNFDRNVFAALYDGSGNHLFSNAWGITAGSGYCAFDANDQIVLHGSPGSNSDFGGGVISPIGLYIVKLEGASGPPTGIGDIPSAAAGELRAYPNPFNPTTTIDYVVDAPGVVTVGVYDVQGRLIEEIVADRSHAAGRYTVAFEAKASGVYFARMQVGDSQRVVKMVAIK